MIALDKFICYYINLDMDCTRNDHCIKLLHDIEFDEINRVVPIDKRSCEIGNSEKTCTRCRHCKGYGKPRGFKSLTMTTQKLFKEILKRDDDTFYFIFEDDIELTSSIERGSFKNTIKNDFLNIVYIRHFETLISQHPIGIGTFERAWVSPYKCPA